MAMVVHSSNDSLYIPGENRPNPIPSSIPQTIDTANGLQISPRLRQGATNDCNTDYHIRTFNGGECQREYDTHPVDVEFRHKGYTGNLEIADSQFPESEGFYFPLRPDNSEGVTVFDTTTHTIYVDGNQYPTVGSPDNIRNTEIADEITTVSESDILETAGQSFLEQTQSQSINTLDLLSNGNASTNANITLGTTTLQTSRASGTPGTNIIVSRRIDGSSLAGTTIGTTIGSHNNRFATISDDSPSATSINTTTGSGYSIDPNSQPYISFNCQNQNGMCVSDMEITSINDAVLRLLP